MSGTSTATKLEIEEMEYGPESGGQANAIAAAANGPYFRSFNYGERKISEDHPHHETYLELGLLRRLIATVREELCAGALKVIGARLTKVVHISTTVHEIVEVTGRQALLAAANPHLEKMKVPDTIHEGLDGLEEWAGKVEEEIEDAA